MDNVATSLSVAMGWLAFGMLTIGIWRYIGLHLLLREIRGVQQRGLDEAMKTAKIGMPNVGWFLVVLFVMVAVICVLGIFQDIDRE